MLVFAVLEPFCTFVVLSLLLFTVIFYYHFTITLFTNNCLLNNRILTPEVRATALAPARLER